MPSGIRGLTFLDEASTANTYAAQLKRRGVQAIVLLIHEGGQQTSSAAVDPNGCTNFSGSLKPILGRLSPDIKVVITGHTHRFYNCSLDGRLVTSASSFGRMFTRVNLTIDRASGRIVSAEARNEIVTRDVARNAAQSRLLAKYLPIAKPIADRVVGSVVAGIPRALNRAGESALGDVIADAQLASANKTLKGGAVVAFMNPGGIRAEIVVGASEAGSGPVRVTYGQLFGIHPFSNLVTGLTMTGSMIKRVLEQQFDNPSPGEATILQVSNGFTYRYRLNAPSGQHVDPMSIAINGRLVAPGDRVRVAVNDFLATGGDNFSVFRQGTNRIPGVIDIDALMAYFRERSPIQPGPQNRIVRID
jgi:5'-nucleotidase